MGFFVRGPKTWKGEVGVPQNSLTLVPDLALGSPEERTRVISLFGLIYMQTVLNIMYMLLAEEYIYVQNFIPLFCHKICTQAWSEGHAKSE